MENSFLNEKEFDKHKNEKFNTNSEQIQQTHVIMINNHKICKFKLDRLIDNNPNLDFDFKSFDGKKIEAICKSSGHHEQYTLNVLCQPDKKPDRKGGGCKVCAGRVRKTDAQFDEELKRINPNLERISPYISAFDPIVIYCKVCDKILPATTPHNILNHPSCSYEKPHKLTHDEFVAKLFLIKPHLRLMGRYTNMKTDVWVKCILHPDHPAELHSPQNLLYRNGTRCIGCRECKFAKLREERMHSNKEIDDILSECNPDVIRIGEYKGTNKRLPVRYKSCGHVASPFVSNLVKGNGCAICKKNRPYTLNSFNHELKKINPNLCVKEYFDNRTKITAYCNVCHKNWKARPYQLLRSGKCKNCNNVNSSSVEEFFLDCFQFILGHDRVRAKDKYAIGRELDIYIPDLNLAFEPGAWVYHKKKIKKDDSKRKECKEKGIILVTIYFDCDQNPADIANDNNNILCVSNNLSKLEDKISLFEELVKKYISDENVKKSINNLKYNDYREIELMSKCNSARKAIEIKKEFNKKNKLFEMVGDYLGAREYTSFSCRICGNMDSFRFYTMAKRKYCVNSNCDRGKKRAERLTLEEFLDKYVKPRDDIVFDSEYDQPDKNHLMVFCKRCGRKWYAPKNSLKDGRKHVCHMSKTPEEFVKQIASLNPNIVICSDYVDAKTKVHFRYADDDKIYVASPDSLLRYYCKKDRVKPKFEI